MRNALPCSVFYFSHFHLLSGVGYHMNMVKKDSCDSRKVDELVKKYVPDAGLESDAGAELSFVLPHESSNR